MINKKYLLLIFASLYCGLFNFSAKAGNITIMPLGDSITAGVDGQTGTWGAYRDTLYRDLVGPTLTGSTIAGSTTTFSFIGLCSGYGYGTTLLQNAGESANNGYGHYTIADVIPNLTGSFQPAGADLNQGGYWLTSGSSGGAIITPTIILVQLGTNDILQGASAAMASGSLGALLQQINALTPTTKIIVSAPPAFCNNSNANTNWQDNTTMQQYCADVQAMLLSSTYSSYTKFVDNFTPFYNVSGASGASPLLGSDNTHPTRFGYAIIGANFANAIRSLEGINPTTYSVSTTSGTITTSGSTTGAYPAGTVLTVMATPPGSGNQFGSWSPANTPLAFDNAYSSVALYTTPASSSALTATYSATNSNILASGTYLIVSDPIQFQMAQTIGTWMDYGAGTAGTEPQNLAFTGGATQQWVVTNVASVNGTNNVVTLTLPSNPNLALTSGTSTILDLETSGTNNNQKWVVTPYTPASVLQLVNLSTDLAICTAGNVWTTTTPNSIGNADPEFLSLYPVSTGGGGAPVITSASTASGTVSNAFIYQIFATNTPTSYNATGLPSGLSVNTSTGAISGVPTASGVSTVTLSAINASGTGTGTLTLTVTLAVPAITSPGTASGTVNSAFSYQITATNSPTSYNATGLPSGLSVNTSTGAITGTPTASGTSTVTLSAINAGGTGTATLTLTINPVAPVVTSATTATGTVNSAFSYQITASNSPTSYNATGLPSGLSVNTSTGAITGTPTASGTSTVTLSAINAGGTGTAALTLTINPAAGSPPVITSALTASGTVNSAFSYQITASNSPTSFNATGLPSGLSVNTGSGAITGTPTASGTSSVALKAINASGTGTATLTLTVVSGTGQPSAVVSVVYGSSTAIPSGTSAGFVPETVWNEDPANVPYFAAGSTSLSNLTDSNNNNSGISETLTTWAGYHQGAAITGFANAGDNDLYSHGPFIETPGEGGLLTLTGLNASVTYNLYIYVNDPNGASGVLTSVSNSINSQNYYLTSIANSAMNSYVLATATTSATAAAGNYFKITGLTGATTLSVQITSSSGVCVDGFQLVASSGTGAAPVITSAATATGTVNSAFSYQITASNSPTSYNATGLPSGLSVNTGSGAITGTPTASGTSSVALKAINASGTGTATLTLTVSPAGSPPVITSAATASGTVNSAFSYQITASNSPTSYNATGLPSGLSVSTASGAITGTPTASGTSSVTLSAINASGTGTATLTLTVSPAGSPPVITSAATATGTVNSAFSYQITASNSPTSYNATGLPSGLSVSTASGAITGTPTASGTSSMTLKAINASGTGTATLTLTVSPAAGSPPVITSALTASGTVNSAFSYQITASNSPTSFNATGLPSGLSVNTGSGAITGTPTASGTSSVTLKAINASGTGTATLTLTVVSGTGQPSAVVSVVYGSSTAIPSGTSAGFVPETVWNEDPANVPYFAAGSTSLSNLTDSNNNNSGISETLTTWAGYHQGAAITGFANAGDNDLYSHGPFIETPGEGGLLTLTGLNASVTYNLYIYVNDPNGASGVLTSVSNSINSQNYYLTSIANSAMNSYVLATATTSATAAAGNYFKITGLTGATTLSVQITSSSGVCVDGFQLVASSGTGAAPVITSAATATGTVNSAFSYQITASNSPTSYNATGLPSGLSVNTSSGAITGTPTASGTSSVTLSAINASGTGTATLTLTINLAAPVITSATTAAGTVNSAFSYQITASNNPASYNATGLPSGLSVSTSSGLISGTPTASGTSSVSLDAINTGGTGTATLTLTVNPVSSGTSSIAIQFVGSGTALTGTSSAGVVAQTHWNPLTGATFSSVVLNDRTGAATTATLTGSADGDYWCGSAFPSGSGDSNLCSGELYCGAFTTETNTTTVSGIPYAQYDVYVYAECDSSGRNATFAVTPSGGSTQYYSLQTTSSGSAWTQSTNTWNGSGTAPSLPVANYVKFTGITASSFTLKFGGAGNVSMNGIEIVKNP